VATDSSCHVIQDPRQAALVAAPIRQRILAALEQPGSATGIARKLGLTRQVAAYHFKELEKHGFLELDSERQRRGCVERVMRRTARYFVASDRVFGRSGLDPRRIKDKFSSIYLMALASRTAQDVGRAQEAADKAGQRLATLSAEAEVRFRTPKDLKAFTDDLVEALARISARYNDDAAPEGRFYRIILGAYPFKPRRSPRPNATGGPA
jgi:predicted ArsR family transcriptional regulator